MVARLLVLGACWAAVACSPIESVIGTTTGAADGSSACPSVALHSDGHCCPVGSFYDHGSGQCRQAGPPECADLLLSAPLACRPHWCATPAMDGGPCSQPVPAEGVCKAGWWPVPWVDGCAPAGLRLRHDASPPAEGAVPALLDHAGLPDVGPLPGIAATRFCATGDGSVRQCRSGEAGCGAGRMPAANGGCQPVGVAWLCPPGFVVDHDAPVAPGDLLHCRADPADCGDDLFAGLQQADGRLFVHGSAPSGGDGTRAAPLRKLSDAVSVAPAGALIAVAQGTYVGTLHIDRPLEIRGRCAAMVTIQGGPSEPALRVDLKSKGPVTVGHVQLTGGSALTVQGSAIVTATRLWAHDTSVSGILAHGAGVSLTLTNSLVADAGSPGHAAVQALAGAEVHLGHVRLSRSKGTGWMAHSAGTRLTAKGLLVADVRAWKQQFGNGAELGEGATADLVGARITGCRSTGLMVEDTGTRITARGLVVDHITATNLAGFFGVGVIVRGGARMDGVGIRLSANHGYGLAATQPGTQVHLAGLLIDDTRPADNLPHGGLGLLAGHGATVESSGARLSGNRSVGLMLHATGTQLTARDLVVDNTLPDAVDGTLGIGVDLQGGARLKLDGGRLHGNRTVGLRVRFDGSRADLSAVLIDGTLPQSNNGALGLGADVDSGARLVLRGCRLRGCRLHGNRGAGVRAHDVGTVARLEGTLVDGTETTGWPAVGGAGVDVARRAVAELIGSRLVGNSTAGLLVTHLGSRARIVGSTIEHTRKGAGGVFGMGIAAIDSGALQLFSSAVVANLGVGVHMDEGTATLDGVVVADNRNSLTRTFQPTGRNGRPALVDAADGVVARAAQGLTVERSLVVKHKRAGFLIDGGSKVFIANSCATGGLYGLASQHQADVRLEAVLLFDNTSNLAADRQLAVPEPPRPLPN